MAEPPLSFKLDEQIHFLQVSGGSPFTLLKEKKKKKDNWPQVRANLGLHLVFQFHPRPSLIHSHTAKSRPALLRIRSPWTDRSQGQLQGRTELAKKPVLALAKEQDFSQTPTHDCGCAHAHAQTAARNFYFVQSHPRGRHICKMSPRDSPSDMGSRTLRARAS